jgi:hypothetical protein
MTNLSSKPPAAVHVHRVLSFARDGRFRPCDQTKKENTDMKLTTILTFATALFCTAGLAVAQTTNTGRCGMPRGTCGNQCDGSGYMNQGRGNGNGQGLRGGPRDGKGRGAGDRQRRRDGSGPGCKQPT